MELAPLPWQQLPVILAVLAAASASLYGLLSLILTRPQVWAPREGQGLDSEAMPLAQADRRRNHQPRPAHLERRLAPR